jgi:Centromere DNA-binding protein complex CBF3 subunit, domain 2
MSLENARLCHTHHTLAHNMVLRFDDRMKILWSDFCTMDAPSQFGTEKLLVCVMDHRKTNKDGSFEAAYAMRHLHNPTRCSWFAFAHELYSQCELFGMNFVMEDFRPIPQCNGSYRHKWYKRQFFYGKTGSRKGIYCQPDPYRPCTYQATNKMFSELYCSIDPPVKGYHVLHCQRGAVVRMADGDGVEGHQIAQAGGWKRQGALYQNYLIGLPTRFLAWASGYKSWKDQDHPRVRRNVLVNPPELWQKVFPFVKEVRDDMADNPSSWIGHDDTLLGFLEVCDVAAKYYVQDLAVMYDEMDQHQVFSTSLFMSHEFFKFRAALTDEMEKQPDDLDLLEPGLGSMKKMFSDMTRQVLKEMARFTDKFEQVSQCVSVQSFKVFSLICLVSVSLLTVLEGELLLILLQVQLLRGTTKPHVRV